MHFLHPLRLALDDVEKWLAEHGWRVKLKEKPMHGWPKPEHGWPADAWPIRTVREADAVVRKYRDEIRNGRAEPCA